MSKLVEIRGEWIDPNEVARVAMVHPSSHRDVAVYFRGIEKPFYVTGPIGDVVKQINQARETGGES